MQDFRRVGPPGVYNDYSLDNRFNRRRQPELTGFPDYLKRAIARMTIDRAEQVRGLKEAQETPR